MKSTPEAIRRNFDQQVERFSNIETGQTTAIDSPLCMELIAQSAKLTNPDATNIMDLGCGGGNYAVKVASLLPHVDCTLVDISGNMVETAQKRVDEIVSGKVTAIQGDYRDVVLGENCFDIITAGTTLHHLRDDNEWELVFSKIFRALKPGAFAQSVNCGVNTSYPSFYGTKHIGYSQVIVVVCVKIEVERRVCFSHLLAIGVCLAGINDIVLAETDEINEMMLSGWMSILKKQVSAEEIALYRERYETEY